MNRGVVRTLIAALGVVLTLAYPAAVYFGLTRWGTRQVTLLLAALVLAGAVLRIPASGREHMVAALKGPSLILPLFALSYVLNDARFLFVMPVLISVVFLISFAGSLRGPMPIVERFARMQVSDLRPEEQRYCRSVTIVWSVFFVMNGITAALLAWLAPVAWWAAYTGLIAYVLMGLLGASEYVVRKAKHGRFGTGPVDRVLKAVLTRGEVGL